MEWMCYCRSSKRYNKFLYPLKKQGWSFQDASYLLDKKTKYNVEDLGKFKKKGWKAKDIGNFANTGGLYEMFYVPKDFTVDEISILRD